MPCKGPSKLACSQDLLLDLSKDFNDVNSQGHSDFLLSYTCCTLETLVYNGVPRNQWSNDCRSHCADNCQSYSTMKLAIALSTQDQTPVMKLITVASTNAHLTVPQAQSPQGLIIRTYKYWTHYCQIWLNSRTSIGTMCFQNLFLQSH